MKAAGHDNPSNAAEASCRRFDAALSDLVGEAANTIAQANKLRRSLDGYHPPAAKESTLAVVCIGEEK